MTINDLIKKYGSISLSLKEINLLSSLAVKDAMGYDSTRKKINYFNKYSNQSEANQLYLYIYDYILLNNVLCHEDKLKYFNYGIIDADKKEYKLNDDLISLTVDNLICKNIAIKFYLKGYKHQLSVLEDYQYFTNIKSNTK